MIYGELCRLITFFQKEINSSVKHILKSFHLVPMYHSVLDQYFLNYSVLQRKKYESTCIFLCLMFRVFILKEIVGSCTRFATGPKIVGSYITFASGPKIAQYSILVPIEDQVLTYYYNFI